MHKKLGIALAIGLLLPAVLMAQNVYLPSVPDKSVIGRIGNGSGSGSVEAIPFATLLAQLNSLANTVVNGPASTTSGDLATWNNTSGTLLKDPGSGTVGGAYTWSGTQTFADAGTWGSGGLNGSNIGTTTAAGGKFTSLNASGQITSTAGTPTIASGACGATTNGAVVAGSTNQSGQITIASATTTTCTITWSATLAVAPNACVFFPMNATAAATGTTVARVGAPSTTQVVLTGSALASANYAYVCL